MSFLVKERLIDELRAEYFLEFNITKIKLALENGADANAPLYEDGSTALHILPDLLPEDDCVIVAQTLLAHGANPNTRDKLGRSSVHAAAAAGFCDLLELLLLNGGDPLLGDIKGLSPVDVAYQRKQTDALNLMNILLDSETYNHPSEQPSEIVLSLWRREVVEIVGIPETVQTGSQNVNNSTVFHEKDKEVDESDLSLMSSQSFSEGYGSYDSLATTNVDDSVFECTNPPVQNKNNCEIHNKSHTEFRDRQPNMNSKRYFEFLRQELVGSTDSDSDTDLLALQKNLIKNLENGYASAKSNYPPVQNDSILNYSCNEFDTAQVSFNMTADESYDASFNFEGTYIPGGMHHHQLYADGDFSLDCSGYETAIYQNDQNDSVNTSHQRKLDFGKNMKANACRSFGDSSCEELDSFEVNLTAPQNMTLPECCTSFALLKAPRKAAFGKTNRKLLDSIHEADDSAICDSQDTQEESILKFNSWCHNISDSFANDSVTKVLNGTDKVDANQIVQENGSTSFYLSKAPSKRSLTETSTKNVGNNVKKQNGNGISDDENLRYLQPRQTSSTENGMHFSEVVGPQSLSEYGTAKSSSSGESSCQSILSVVEEFIYKDLDAGITLIERRCPTSSSFTSLLASGNKSGTSTLTRGQTVKGPLSIISEDVPDGVNTDLSLDSVGTLTDSIKGLGGEPLRKKLIDIGFTPGPVLPSTRRVYQRHLLRLRKHPELLDEKQKDTSEYPRELRFALANPSAVEWHTWMCLEKTMCALFNQPDPSRYWRDGTNKTCFNYLLLDPRITQDLPIRGMMMEEAERFQCFISAIFYIGKGSRNRPYFHLYEAMNTKESKRPKSEKVKRIQEIWSKGVGVVSLHVFQNTIPVEAWTREAVMISALGLQNLSNSIKGTFYGVASTWKSCEQRRVGTLLLQRALNIFMLEGERQLRPCDVTPPSWCK